MRTHLILCMKYENIYKFHRDLIKSYRILL
nr:MAG TPA: hypothetical protein [Bacteriophage sp.]